VATCGVATGVEKELNSNNEVMSITPALRRAILELVLLGAVDV